MAIVSDILYVHFYDRYANLQLFDQFAASCVAKCDAPGHSSKYAYRAETKMMVQGPNTNSFFMVAGVVQVFGGQNYVQVSYIFEAKIECEF